MSLNTHEQSKNMGDDDEIGSMNGDNIEKLDQMLHNSEGFRTNKAQTP